MTNKELHQEFKRWLELGRPKVFAKEGHNSDWSLLGDPSWNSPKLFYVVDDEFADVKKKMYEDSRNVVQVYLKDKCEWVNDPCPLWIDGFKYRIKPLHWYQDETAVGKLIWVRNSDNDEWEISIFKKFIEESRKFIDDDDIEWSHVVVATESDIYKKPGE